MGALTQHLKDEHRMIWLALDALDLYRAKLLEGYDLEKSEISALLFLLRKLVEDIHHRKEEILLFKALSESGRIEGGPRCSYFMSVRMEFNPSEKLLSLARRTQSEPNARDGSIAPLSCALSIPLEDHEAGHFALMRITLELDLYESGVSHEDTLAAYILDYTRLMRHHIEKEDTCLFEMADQVLSEETQLKLLSDAYAINRSIMDLPPHRIQPLLDKIIEAFNKAPLKAPRKI